MSALVFEEDKSCFELAYVAHEAAWSVFGSSKPVTEVCAYCAID
jgi:hypothetical protein